jgi:flagellar biosynthesis GTPase FlhF
MATAKKPAAKKPTAKKPAAKKTTAKKTAAKKPAAKKTAAKKPAAKKTTAKKPAAKKTAAKKPAAKAASAKKTTAKKPAAKKTVAKKPAAKAAPKATAKPVEVSDAKFRNLFDAYSQGKLPFAQGYIVSSFFSETSNYSIYEIVSYAGVKEIFMTETGLQFVTGGKKLYVLLEPDTYQIKFQEPVSRAEGEKIPKRFNELEIITARNQSKIMIAKEPNESYGSFTILKPTGVNFAVVFYQLPDVYQTLTTFFTDTLNRQRKVPESDAKKASQLIADILKKHMSFEGEFK